MNSDFILSGRHWNFIRKFTPSFSLVYCIIQCTRNILKRITIRKSVRVVLISFPSPHTRIFKVFVACRERKSQRNQLSEIDRGIIAAVEVERVHTSAIYQYRLESIRRFWFWWNDLDCSNERIFHICHQFDAYRTITDTDGRKSQNVCNVFSTSQSHNIDSSSNYYALNENIEYTLSDSVKVLQTAMSSKKCFVRTLPQSSFDNI